MLITIDDNLEKSFYEKECVAENWNVRSLRRQMSSALYLRLAANLDRAGQSINSFVAMPSNERIGDSQISKENKK